MPLAETIASRLIHLPYNFLRKSCLIKLYLPSLRTDTVRPYHREVMALKTIMKQKPRQLGTGRVCPTAA